MLFPVTVSFIVTSPVTSSVRVSPLRINSDLLDHVIVLNERHLKRLMSEYIHYYHEDRTHLGLSKETPAQRRAENDTNVNANVVAVPKRLMSEYVRYYHEDRTHLGLGKQTPARRIPEKGTAPGTKVLPMPRFGGLHHRYKLAA
jgi:hypothetical protein